MIIFRARKKVSKTKKKRLAHNAHRAAGGGAGGRPDTSSDAALARALSRQLNGTAQFPAL